MQKVFSLIPLVILLARFSHRLAAYSTSPFLRRNRYVKCTFSFLVELSILNFRYRFCLIEFSGRENDYSFKLLVDLKPSLHSYSYGGGGGGGQQLLQSRLEVHFHTSGDCCCQYILFHSYISQFYLFIFITHRL